LFKACLGGNKTILKYLVKHGANINKKNKYGQTPLYYASIFKKPVIVQYLIELGANH